MYDFRNNFYTPKIVVIVCLEECDLVNHTLQRAETCRQLKITKSKKKKLSCFMTHLKPSPYCGTEIKLTGSCKGQPLVDLIQACPGSLTHILFWWYYGA